MKKTCILLAAALAAAGMAAAQTASGKPAPAKPAASKARKSTKPAPAPAPGEAAPAGGLKAFKDPVTGQLRPGEVGEFQSLLLFSALWALIVYFPAAHMVWGKGGLLAVAFGSKTPVYDFAGGTVVHITSGFSALVTALYLGKRNGYPSEPMKPHNLVLSFTGACLLWFGWFGFNAGSALAASGLATSAFVATHFASAAGALAWMAAERIRSGKASALGAISGSVAGLATITQASGFVAPFPALLIGAMGGFICFLMVIIIKSKFGYDDSLDAFGVHGVGGVIGCMMTGVFGSRLINGQAGPLGLVDGNPGQILNQGIGALTGIALAVVGTLICLKVTDMVLGMRMKPYEETAGMDLNIHGEEGYNFES